MGRFLNHRFSDTLPREQSSVFKSGIQTLKRWTLPLTGGISVTIDQYRGRSHYKPEISHTMGKKKIKGKAVDIFATDANTLDTVPDLSLPLQGNGHEEGTTYNGESSNGNDNQLAPARAFDPENLPLIQATTAMDASLCEAQRRFKAFRKTCQSESRDLLQLNDFRQQLTLMKNLCKEKDAKIDQQKSAILELDSIREGVRMKYDEMCAEVQASRHDLEDKRQAFEKHVLKEEKSMQNKRAEDELEAKKELATLKGELEKEIDEKLHQSMQELRNHEEETERMRQETECVKAELKQQVGERDKAITTLKSKLKKEKEEGEEQVRLKNSFKDENIVLHKKLLNLENEFAIGGNQPEHYMNQFKNIFTTIESISLDFFSEVVGQNDQEMDIQKQMAKLDPCFNSVPFSKNEDSQRLIIAHVQRIISTALVSKFWKPYVCENAQAHPEFVPVLKQIMEVLSNTANGHNMKRKSRLWYVWTMQAMHTRAFGFPSPRSFKIEVGDEFAEEILSRLKPIINPKVRDALSGKLHDLAHDSMLLWNEAQIDRLDFEIILNLDPAHQNQWWTQDFDEDNDAATSLSWTSKTRPRIFTRFPRIIARAPDFDENSEASKPQEIIIHPGLGLPEWSVLVISGKEEVKERQEREKTLRERVAKEMMKEMSERAPKRASSSRRGSMAISVHLPSSPTARWNEAKTMVVAE